MKKTNNINKLIKLTIFVTILLAIVLTSCKSYAAEQPYIDYTDRSDIILNAFSEWMETFKGENIPEEKRITDFKWSGYSTIESNPNKIRARIEFTVTPVLKENTKWEYSEPKTIEKGELEIKWSKTNICYLEMTNVNGEYQVDYMAETPKGYDEFTKRFEEYQQNNSQTEEVVQIQGKETENNLSNQEIEKMSNIVTVSCSTILVLVIGTISIKFIKRKSKK